MNDEPMDPTAIPDLTEMTNIILQMIDFMNSGIMLKKKSENKDEYERIVIFKYQDKIPYNIIRLLLEDIKNLGKLITMFETLTNIKKGNLDIEKEYDKFGENLNEEYLYPQFGGKDKFISKMTELNEK